MQVYQQEFIQFALECRALQFGEFTLKSGRISPYFFNGGQFNSGLKLAKLGRFYAQALQDSNLQPDILFGPAYKGITLVSALAIALAEQYRLDLPYAFNRKEAKDHGEGGTLVGAELTGKALIVDDVVTAGTSVKESIQLFSQTTAQACGVLIALDRQELLDGNGQSTIEMIKQTYSIPVISIITFTDLASFVEQSPAFDKYQEQMQSYRQRYGVQSVL